MNRSTSQFLNFSISQLPSHGQSLIELVIGMALGVILITATVNIIAVNLRNSLETRTVQTAAALLQEYRDALQAIGDSNWLTMYCPPAGICPGDPKGGASQFYLKKTGTMYGIMGGTTSTIIEGRTFTRYFSIENINREDCGVGKITASAAIPCPLFEQGSGAIAEDPSTQKIVMTVGWTGGRSAQMTQYLTRNKNRILHQTDWSNGSGQVSFPTSTQGTIINGGFASGTNINVTSTPGSIIVMVSPGQIYSSVFDTGRASGTAVATIMWKGDLQGGSGSAKFQIASSDCENGATNPPTCDTGTWDFKGPDGTGSTLYTGVKDVMIKINPAYHNNDRYLRYTALIEEGGGIAPRVDDIIMSWLP